MNYNGILFFGQSLEMAGRGIGGYRLRTAAKKAGYNILIIDFVGDINSDQIQQIIASNYSENLKFIGFSTSWIDISNEKSFSWLNEDFFVSVKNKFPSLKIITGGHDELNRKLLLKYSNYHFHGFSDNTFVEFLKMINGRDDYKLQMTKNNLLFKGQYIDSNNSDPVIDPNTIETVFEKDDGFERFQPIPIEISRGCIFRCGFCRHPFQGKKEYDSYQRSSENIAKELSRNYELFGTTRYTIMDDTFNDSIEKIDRLRKAIDIANLPKFEFVAYIRPELLVTKPEMITMLGDLGLRGAFFGIESFNKVARKAIGKGTDIERILDAAHKMASYNNNQMLIHASLIVGLPSESREEILKTQEFLNSLDSPFRSWYWQALGIRNDGISPKDSQSIFDKKFEDYGYEIPLNSRIWKNEYFDFYSAHDFTNKLNKETSEKQRYAGWRVAGAWQVNMPEDEIQYQYYNHNTFVKKIKSISQDRVTKELTRILG